MKMGIIAGLVILLLIILLTVFNIYLEADVNDIITNIALMDSHIKNNNYDTAYNNFKNAKNIWDKKEKIFELMIDNSELDEISKIFEEINSYFKNNEYDEYGKSSNSLCFLLKHIVSKNKVNIETIF